MYWLKRIRSNTYVSTSALVRKDSFKLLTCRLNVFQCSIFKDNEESLMVALIHIPLILLPLSLSLSLSLSFSLSLSRIRLQTRWRDVKHNFCHLTFPSVSVWIELKIWSKVKKVPGPLFHIAKRTSPVTLVLIPRRTSTQEQMNAAPSRLEVFDVQC